MLKNSKLKAEFAKCLAFIISNIENDTLKKNEDDFSKTLKVVFPFKIKGTKSITDKRLKRFLTNEAFAMTFFTSLQENHLMNFLFATQLKMRAEKLRRNK